ERGSRRGDSKACQASAGSRRGNRKGQVSAGDPFTCSHNRCRVGSHVDPLQPNPAKPAFKNFDEIGALEDGDTIALPKLSSKKPRDREEEESQRLKRIMAICAGC